MPTVLLLVCSMLALSEAVETPMNCPRGWTEYNGRCFHYTGTIMTWAQAERNCLTLGANLASVHSIDEYGAIQDLIRRQTRRNGLTWIGGSDAQENGVWLWSDGTSFDYQHCGSLNNGRNQDCLQMNFGGGLCWNDNLCSNRLPSVCAKDVLTLINV